MTRTGYAMVLALLAAPLSLEGQDTAARDAASKVAEAFVGKLGAGDFAGAAGMVGPQMKAAGVTEEMLRLTWQQLSAPGAMRSARVTAINVVQVYHVVDLVVDFGGSPQGLRISVDTAKQVEGFRVFAAVPPKYDAPQYADTSKIEEVELTVGAEGWPLGATLTLPRGVARAPVVVLVHGSGSHDRNETIGNLQPFHDLAWGLASRGVAVLRYEKRGWKHATRMVGKPITVDDEVIADAQSAIVQAGKQQRIDPARIFLLGHSLGGLLAPEIAVRSGQLAGVILLAGSPRSLPALVLEQLAYLGTLPDNAAPAAQQQLAEMRTQMERILKHDYPATEMVGGAPASYFYDLEQRDPAAFIRKLSVPVLVLQGARDYQVTEQDFELWRQALAGRKDAVFQLYPDLNHLFMPGQGKATPAEYAAATGHMDVRVIADIASFVQRR